MAAIDGPIYLSVQPSPQLRRGIVSAHAVAAALAFVSFPGDWLRIGVSLLIVMNGWWQHRRSRLVRPDAVAAVLLTSGGQWCLSLHNGQVLDAQLRRALVITPQLTTLSFDDQNQRRRELALLPVNVPGAAFRRLRVRLRFPLVVVD